MTVILEARGQLGLDTFRRVAWDGEPVALSSNARSTMGEARDGFLRMLESEPEAVVYGTNTRAGDGARVRLEPEAMRAQGALAPPKGPSWGSPLPERVVRGIVLARVAGWLEGHGGVRPELAAAVLEMLDGRRLPAVPAEGNGGAGEIVALGHLFHDFARGFGTEVKEPMALINGSPCATSLVSDAALSATRRMQLAHEVFALSAEAIRAPLESYDEALERLWADRYESEALRHLRSLLAGGSPTRRPYQSPVSWRVVPRMLGRTRRAVAAAVETAELALRSVTDNPVYLPPWEAPPNGRALSNGGYHNASAYAALDGLTSAFADLVQLLERQCEQLAFPPGAAPAGEGFRMFVMVQSAWAEAARAAAQMTVLGLGGQGQNDTPAPTFFAYQRFERVSFCLDASLAVVAALSAVALGRSGGPVAPALERLLAATRACFSEEEGGERGEELRTLQECFTRRATSGAGGFADLV